MVANIRWVISTVIVGAVLCLIQRRQARAEKVPARYLELWRTVPDDIGIKTLIAAGVLTLKSNSDVRAGLHRVEQLICNSTESFCAGFRDVAQSVFQSSP
jgi:hypothetical protein